jgi:hypothetical protein
MVKSVLQIIQDENEDGLTKSVISDALEKVAPRVMKFEKELNEIRNEFGE